MVTKRLDERSYEVETQAGTYGRDRADLKEQSLPRPLEQNATPAVTPDKERTSPSTPPGTPAANRLPSKQKTTPVSPPVSQLHSNKTFPCFVALIFIPTPQRGKEISKGRVYYLI